MKMKVDVSAVESFLCACLDSFFLTGKTEQKSQIGAVPVEERLRSSSCSSRAALTLASVSIMSADRGHARARRVCRDHTEGKRVI